MAEKIGRDTIQTLIEHGVIAPKQPSEPKPTLAALFAAATDNRWTVVVRPAPDGATEGAVEVGVEAGEALHARTGPLLTALAEATAEALED